MTLQDAKALGHSMEQILKGVCTALRVGKLDMYSPHRAAHLVEARHIFYWCARYFTARSYPEIGRFIKRDHATVMHGVRKVDQNFVKLAPKLRAVAAEIGVKLCERQAA